MGRRVVMLHRPRTAPLLVGESLVPAIVLMLRKLGLEEEVAGYSQYKPGAAFDFGADAVFPFLFKDFCGSFPPHAYNVPRIQFEDTLLAAAKREGAAIIDVDAGLERVDSTDKVRFNKDTLAACGDYLAQPPDLIVDATGRARVLPKMLNIPHREGGRKDTAMFAHLDKAKLYGDGYVHSSRMDHGWSWRIPLPGRVSLGVVIGPEHLSGLGATKEDRYDNLLQRDSFLKEVAGGAKRLTPVMDTRITNLFPRGWSVTDGPWSETRRVLSIRYFPADYLLGCEARSHWRMPSEMDQRRRLRITSRKSHATCKYGTRSLVIITMAACLRLFQSDRNPRKSTHQARLSSYQ